MRIIAAALVVAAFATPALSQSAASLGGPAPSPFQNLNQDISHPKSIDEINRQQEAERSYSAGLKRIPDQKASNDPWGSVRTETKPNQAKTAVAPKKPKAE